MIFNWYKIINRTAFEATGLVSREVQAELVGIGLKTILVTKGRLFSITYEGVMLSPDVVDSNPFIFDGLAVYQDASADIWLGVP